MGLPCGGCHEVVLRGPEAALLDERLCRAQLQQAPEEAAQRVLGTESLAQYREGCGAVARVSETDAQIEIVGAVGVEDLLQLVHHPDGHPGVEDKIEDGGAQAVHGYGVEDERGVEAEVAAGPATARPEQVRVLVVGGGLVSAVLRPIEGGERIARAYVEIGAAAPGLTIREKTVNGRPGPVSQYEGVNVTVFAFDIAGDRIRHIWAVRNPEKLRPWQGR
ncbi:hypothetical protein ACGFMO_36905 [Streptomyces niveus]|uniref:hypothetical protein n=1 Tax=Streptomyces niveus TaxID=193462 RepID=UPI003715899E